VDAEHYAVVWLPDAGGESNRVSVIGPLDEDQIWTVEDVHRRLGHPVRVFELSDIEGYGQWRNWAEEYAGLEPA
jgi:hypothetical protein